MTPSASGLRGGHLSRICVIAMHAFTQLVRMKVFYFMAVFALIAILSNFFDLPQHAGPESSGISVLSQIKGWSFGAMHIFSVVLGIVATALLLPKDVEDRTLYTILAKPVPRIDYLAGKLLGVLALIFVSLLLMDLLMVAVLHVRTGMVLEEQIAMAQHYGWPEHVIASVREETIAQGPSWSLQGAVLAVFLRAVVISSVALLISTFSTSTLFTTIITFLVYFIGHFQADARDVYLGGETGDGVLARLLALLLSLVLPDMQLFNVIDAAIQGQTLPAVSVLKLALVGLFYAVLYTIASWFIFADKEF
jgi:ABC-2 type transport system permease protein